MPFFSYHQGRQGDAGGFCGRGQRRGPSRRRQPTNALPLADVTIKITTFLIHWLKLCRLFPTEGWMDPRTSSYRGSGNRDLGRHRSHSTTTRPQNRHLQSNQWSRHPEQSYTRRHHSQDKHERYQNQMDRRTKDRPVRSRGNFSPPKHQNEPHNQNPKQTSPISKSGLSQFSRIHK